MSKNKKQNNDFQSNSTDVKKDVIEKDNTKKWKNKDKKKNKKRKKIFKKISSDTKKKIVVFSILFVFIASAIGGMILSIQSYQAQLEYEAFLESDEYKQLLEEFEKQSQEEEDSDKEEFSDDKETIDKETIDKETIDKEESTDKEENEELSNTESSKTDEK